MSLVPNLTNDQDLQSEPGVRRPLNLLPVKKSYMEVVRPEFKEQNISPS